MRESSLPTDRTSVESVVREVLRTCDANMLARRLGLRNAEAASALRANEAALSHLTIRLADECQGLDPDKARALAMALFDCGAVAEDGDE